MGMGDITSETIVGVRLTLKQWVAVIIGVSALASGAVVMRSEILSELRALRATLIVHEKAELLVNSNMELRVTRLEERQQDVRERLRAIEQHIDSEADE